MPGLIEAIASTVIFLFSAGSQPLPIGTGFLIGFPVPSQEGNYIPLVVTARHVLGSHRSVLARFSTEEGLTTKMVEYDIAALRASNDYWEHPTDNGVDIAVFRSLHHIGTDYKTIPIELIATKSIFQNEEIQQTDRIMIPSLLINFMGSAMNYPVFRGGIIASIPTEKVPIKYMSGGVEIVTEQEIILIDATCVQGASGSPIFLWPGLVHV